MAMITEDYVSFEVAKLLKEKGFEGECSRFYMPSGHGRWKYEHYHDFDIRERIDCPTPQMAMKWLREIHHLEIYPFHDSIQEHNMWWYRIEKHIKGIGWTEFESEPKYLKYEEAVEAAIKYCLKNLI